jgi:signal transduction histidine kinase
LIPSIVIQLAERLSKEHATLLAEQEHLSRNIDHIKGIVVMQQSIATASGVLEKIRPGDLLCDALEMHSLGFEHNGIEVIRECANLPPMVVDRHKIMQVLVNLLTNAERAIVEARSRGGRINVSLKMAGDDRVRMSIADNGVGIPPENLTRIFSHGFTTRHDGHGFGLHSGALAAREMGGSLTVHSDGPGLGATFTLELPVRTTESLN